MATHAACKLQTYFSDQPRVSVCARRVEVPAAPPPVPVWTPPLAQVMARAAALAAALDDLGPLQVTSRLALVPREALREVFGLQLDTMLRSLAGRVASRVSRGMSACGYT